jgi:hypothetical protein
MSCLALARAALSEGASHEINEENEQTRSPVVDRCGGAIPTCDTSFTSFISSACLPATLEDEAEVMLRGGIA